MEDQLEGETFSTYWARFNWIISYYPDSPVSFQEKCTYLFDGMEVKTHGALYLLDTDHILSRPGDFEKKWRLMAEIAAQGLC
jgi:hypothetical protein